MRTCCSAAERLGTADPGRVFPAFALAAGVLIFGENRLIIESASLNLKYPFGLSLSKPGAALRQAQRERFK